MDLQCFAHFHNRVLFQIKFSLLCRSSYDKYFVYYEWLIHNSLRVSYNIFFPANCILVFKPSTSIHCLLQQLQMPISSNQHFFNSSFYFFHKFILFISISQAKIIPLYIIYFNGTILCCQQLSTS